MSTQKFSNNADSFLDSSILLGATSFSVLAGDGSLFPTLSSEEHFYVRIGSDIANEVVKITGRSTDSFTCEATKSAWAEGSQVSLTVSAEMLGEFMQPGMPIVGSEFSDYVESIIAESPDSGGVLNIDLSVPYHVITLDKSASSVTFSNLPPSGSAASYTLEIIQDSTGGRSITWPSSIATPGGGGLTLEAAANEYDLVVLSTRDGGATFGGLIAGAALS